MFESADRLRLIDQIVHEPPVPPRQLDRRIPRDLETIVLKALAKDPKDRFATADELAAELRRFLENRPIRSRPIPAYERIWRWCKRNPGRGRPERPGRGSDGLHRDRRDRGGLDIPRAT